MKLITSLRSARGLRRLTPILAIGMLALLSACVVYPAGYYGPPHGGYYGGYYDHYR